MSNITITQDNLSKFTKRLHKALSEHHASNPTAPNLSQSGELFAKALGAVNLHELQTLLGVAPVSFEEQWVNTIEQTIRDYLKSTPQSKLKSDEIYWGENGSNTYLQLYSHSEDGEETGEGVGFEFRENKKMPSAQDYAKNLNDPDGYAIQQFELPQCDIDFCVALAKMFPNDVVENLKIVEFLKSSRGIGLHSGKWVTHEIVPQTKTPLPVPTTSTPEQQWVKTTEQSICNHLKAHPNSKLSDVSWSSTKFPNVFLKLYDHVEENDVVIYGTYFKLKVDYNKKAVSEVQSSKLYEGFDLPDYDTQFLDQLAKTFPSDVIENLKIAEFLQTYRGVSAKTPYKIEPVVPKAKNKM